MVVGHEYVDEVVGTDQGVKDFKAGDHASGEGHIICGHCRSCHDRHTHPYHNMTGVDVNCPGCSAGYLMIPTFNTFKIPDNIPDNLASIFSPSGSAVHTALPFGLAGEDMLASGAGLTGIMAAAAAKHVGACHMMIIDVDRYRPELAHGMDITRAVSMSKENLIDVTAGLGMIGGLDVSLEILRAPPVFRATLDATNHGGRTAMLGISSSDISVDWAKVISKGLFTKGIYGCEVFEIWCKTVALI